MNHSIFYLYSSVKRKNKATHRVSPQLYDNRCRETKNHVLRSCKAQYMVMYQGEKYDEIGYLTNSTLPGIFCHLPLTANFSVLPPFLVYE